MAIIKDIKKHEDFIKTELAGKEGQELKDLLLFHQNQVRNFQHERLVHLLVTLFFGLANLLALGMTLLYPAAEMLLLDAIFLVMLLFYIKYYFSLENSIQRLYRLGQEIAEKI